MTEPIPSPEELATCDEYGVDVLMYESGAITCISAKALANLLDMEFTR